MTDIEFFAVVAKMRQSQKKYFATRSNDPTKTEHLKESKRLEKIIDSEITQRLKSINAATLKCHFMICKAEWRKDNTNVIVVPYKEEEK